MKTNFFFLITFITLLTTSIYSQVQQDWVQRYDGPGNFYDAAYSIAVDDSGNVYVTGGSDGSGSNYDYATIKYNSSGAQGWEARYNGPGNGDDEANSLAVDASGNVYVTGWSYGSGTNWDYATIKYNPSGVQGWIQRYNGPGDSTDRAYSIAVDGSGNVYVTGWSYGSGTNWDYATIKYSQQIGIKPISAEIPKSFLLYQNYPNPFNPSTKIRFSIPLSRGVSAEGNGLPAAGRGVLVKLVIYDIIGREVATLVNEQLKLGTYEVDFDASSLPSGVYFYKLITESFSNTKRMVLIK